MTPEAQRIAIAEACGWTHDSLDLPAKKGTKWVNPSGKINHQCLFPDFPIEVPNYPEDLNAMHEAEESLDEEQLKAYRLELMLRVGGHIHFRATSSQRAEAFLKVINLWTDS